MVRHQWGWTAFRVAQAPWAQAAATMGAYGLRSYLNQKAFTAKVQAERHKHLSKKARFTLASQQYAEDTWAAQAKALRAQDRPPGKTHSRHYMEKRESKARSSSNTIRTRVYDATKTLLTFPMRDSTAAPTAPSPKGYYFGTNYGVYASDQHKNKRTNSRYSGTTKKRRYKKKPRRSTVKSRSHKGYGARTRRYRY